MSTSRKDYNRIKADSNQLLNQDPEIMAIQIKATEFAIAFNQIKELATQPSAEKKIPTEVEALKVKTAQELKLAHGNVTNAFNSLERDVLSNSEEKSTQMLSAVKRACDKISDPEERKNFLLKLLPKIKRLINNGVEYNTLSELSMSTREILGIVSPDP